jgi:hypothetical protein
MPKGDAVAVRTIDTDVEIDSHASVRAWRATGAQSLPHKITELNTKKKSVVCLLEGAVAFPLVAKLSSRESAAVEVFVYEHVLPALGEPFPRFLGSVRDSDERTWLFCEHIGDEPFRFDDSAHLAAGQKWVAALHSMPVDAAVRTALPDAGPLCHLSRLDEALNLIGLRRSNTALTAAHQATLNDVVKGLEQLRSMGGRLLDEAAGRTGSVVHGDLTDKHLRVRTDAGTIRFYTFDWEHAGVGYPGTDLARMFNSWRPGDFWAYCGAVVAARRDLAIVDAARMIRIGWLFQLMTHVYWATGELRRERVDGAVQTFEKYRRQIETTLAELGWS